MGHGGDVIAELTTDHREVDELFEQLDNAVPGSDRRKQLVDSLTIELVRHSVAEEQHLYPAVREHLDGGDAIADRELADHARVENLLKELEGRDAGDVDFDRLVRELRTEATAHVADEEDSSSHDCARACTPTSWRVLGKGPRGEEDRPPPSPQRPGQSGDQQAPSSRPGPGRPRP